LWQKQRTMNQPGSRARPSGKKGGEKFLQNLCGGGEKSKRKKWGGARKKDPVIRKSFAKPTWGKDAEDCANRLPREKKIKGGV